MNTSKWAFAALLVASFTAADAARLQSVALSHYEPVEQLQIRSVAARSANGAEAVAAGPVVMSFGALGRSFELELEPNRPLLSVARQNPKLDGVQIYRGAIPGRAGSWARIVVANGMPSGIFWDGKEMYAIEAPGDSIVDAKTSVVFRLADVRVAPGALSCGSSPVTVSGNEAFQSLVGEFPTKAEALGAIDEIGVGVIGDFEFTSARGGDAAAAAAITTRLNNVDGIFSSQLGVQITVNTIETYSSADDPFSDESDASVLLDEVSDYRLATPAQNSNGLTHLYTGKNLDGTTVGIAYTGALCSNFFGTGLSEGNGGATFDSLVAAHEIGHNFGAPHDNEADSACESEAGSFLMSPQLNGSDQFSQCSIEQMVDDIAEASCITPLPAVDMRPVLTSGNSVLFGATAFLSYEIANVGSIDATGVTVDFTLPANLTLDAITSAQGTCTSTAVSASCDIGPVPGQAARSVDITATPTAIGAGTISATVTADEDDRVSNNEEALQLSVVPAVDLVVTPPPGSSIRVDRSATIIAALENRATIDATNVTVSMDLGSSLRATAASWPIGTCSVDTAQRVTCQAARFVASSNTTVSVTASGVSEGSPRVNYSLASTEPDLVPTNNSGVVRIEVRDPDDEGGGSTGPVFVLLMLLAAFLRRR